MAQTSGQRSTYTDTVLQKRVISDKISVIDPMEFALINALGYTSKNVGKFRLQNWPGTTYEWLEDTYEARSDTVASTNITNSTTTTTMTITTGAKFQVGQVCQIDSDAELIYVSAISGTTLTIVRGYAGTTQTTHASNGTIYIRTRARVEGADASDSPTTNPTTQYNYTQIFEKKVEVTRSRQKVTKYGIANEYDFQVAKFFKELLRDCENIAFYGQRGAGTSSVSRMAGGLDYFITTNVNALSGSPALTQTHIEDKVQSAWEYGGNPRLLVCNAWAQRKIRDMYSGSVRTVQDSTRGGITIDKILAPPVGELDVLVVRACPSSKIYLLDPDRVGWVPFDDFFDQPLAITGDAKKGEVIGEYGFVVQNEKAHAIISGFSTSK